MKTSTLFKTTSILWIVWGLVHIIAGVLTMKGASSDIHSAIQGIADGVDLQNFSHNYPAALGGLLGQHGFNLMWFGLVTLISAFFIWNGRKTFVLLASLVGGLADLGYFLFLDLGGYVKFVPGTIMTLVALAAVIIGLVALRKQSSS